MVIKEMSYWERVVKPNYYDICKCGKKKQKKSKRCQGCMTIRPHHKVGRQLRKIENSELWFFIQSSSSYNFVERRVELKVPECELLEFKNDSFKGKVPKCHESDKPICLKPLSAEN